MKRGFSSNPGEGVELVINKERFSPGAVLFPVGVGTALSLMGDATLYTVLPTHTAEAGVALASIGILLSANRFIRLLLNSAAGIAIDRWNRRGLFLLALFVGVLSTGIYAFAGSFWPLLGGRLLWGLAWSGIWVGGTTIILETANNQERGRLVGLYQTWFFFGSAFGALAGGVLTDWLGYRMTMWVAMGVSGLGLAVATVFLPEVAHAEDNPVRTMQGVHKRGGLAKPSLWAATTIYGINRLVFAGVLAATIALVVESHLKGRASIFGAASLTGLLIAARSLINMFSAPLAGNLSDRLRSRWQVILGGLALASVSMLLISMPGLLLAIAGVLLGAFAGGFIQAPAVAVTGDLTDGEKRGRAVGILQTGGDLGSALGPPLAYLLIPLVGLPGVYRVCAGLFALSLVVVAGISKAGVLLELESEKKGEG